MVGANRHGLQVSRCQLLPAAAALTNLGESERGCGMIHIRMARRLDAPGIARVHATTWKEAYRGLLDGAYLDSLSEKRLAVRWRTHRTSGFTRRTRSTSGANPNSSNKTPTPPW